jgi:hypothetical protein
MQRFDGQPDVVIRAVQAVVRAARDHTCRPPRRLLFAGVPVQLPQLAGTGTSSRTRGAAGQWGLGMAAGSP